MNCQPTTPANRHSVYMTFGPDGMPVTGSIRQNVGRSLRAAASRLDTSTDNLVNSGFTVRAGRLYVDKTSPIVLNKTHGAPS